MATITLYHNPRCSKSRQALALLEEHGIEYRIHRYLDEPLTVEELDALLSRLESPLESLIRTNEKEWKALDIDNDDRPRILAAVAAEPRLMQRPIVDDGKRAIIGRPPEAVMALLGTP